MPNIANTNISEMTLFNITFTMCAVYSKELGVITSFAIWCVKATEIFTNLELKGFEGRSPRIFAT